MLTLTIDNQAVSVPEGATLLEAAGKLGIAIPTLCWWPGLPPQTSCFVCVVKVAGQAGLAPACATKAAEGMAVDASGPEVRLARRTALELLLSDHVGDCVAPCQRAHPEKVAVPLVLRLVRAGKWAEAAGVLEESRKKSTAEHAESAEGEKKEKKEPGKGPRWENACRRAQIDAPIAIDAVLRHVAEKGKEGLAKSPAAEREGQEGKDAFTVVIGKLREEEKREFMKEGDSAGRARCGSGGELTDEQAMQEAARCLHCDCRRPVSCRLRKFAQEYGARHTAFHGPRRNFTQDRSHERVIFEPGKCIACGLCVQVAQGGTGLGLSFVGRGYDMRPAVPFGETLAAGLGDKAQECVKVCPTGALAFGEGEE